MNFLLKIWCFFILKFLKSTLPKARGFYGRRSQNNFTLIGFGLDPSHYFRRASIFAQKFAERMYVRMQNEQMRRVCIFGRSLYRADLGHVHRRNEDRTRYRLPRNNTGCGVRWMCAPRRSDFLPVSNWLLPDKKARKIHFRNGKIVCYNYK